MESLPTMRRTPAQRSKLVLTGDYSETESPTGAYFDERVGSTEILNGNKPGN
jgi:hypothetical protein